jgi:hypothetical protein
MGSSQSKESSIKQLYHTLVFSKEDRTASHGIEIKQFLQDIEREILNPDTRNSITQEMLSYRGLEALSTALTWENMNDITHPEEIQAAAFKIWIIICESFPSPGKVPPDLLSDAILRKLNNLAFSKMQEHVEIGVRALVYLSKFKEIKEKLMGISIINTFTLLSAASEMKRATRIKAITGIYNLASGSGSELLQTGAISTILDMLRSPEFLHGPEDPTWYLIETLAMAAEDDFVRQRLVHEKAIKIFKEKLLDKNTKAAAASAIRVMCKSSEARNEIK